MAYVKLQCEHAPNSTHGRYVFKIVDKQGLPKELDKIMKGEIILHGKLFGDLLKSCSGLHAPNHGEVAGLTIRGWIRKTVRFILDQKRQTSHLNEFLADFLVRGTELVVEVDNNASKILNLGLQHKLV